MAIITISREFGSAGDPISKMAADSLGYPLIDKKAIEHVLVQYGMVNFDEVYESDHSIWQKFDKEITRIIKMLDNTIRAFAARDNLVIVGRGAFAVLQGYRNVLNVAIREPLAERVHQVVKANDMSRSDAEILVKNNDQIRRSFLQTYYGIKEDSISHFDLCVDTSKFPSEKTAAWIIEAARQIDANEKASKTPVGIHTRSLDVDPILAGTIADALKSLS